MNRVRRLGWDVFVGVMCVSWLTAPTAAQPVSGRKEHVLFDNKTGYWRGLLYWKTPKLLRDDGTFAPLRGALDPRRHKTDADRGPAEITSTTPPLTDWFKPDFDDAKWIRQHGTYGPAPVTRPYIHDHRFLADDPANTAVIHLRGLIEVTDPARCKDLQILIRYYGGAVVYINGKEVKRAHLPTGTLTPDTLADKYTRDAYEREAFEIEEYRLRQLKMFIRPAMLEKGRNVIAIAVYRAPILERLAKKEGKKPVEVWSHAWVKRVMLYSMYGMIPKDMVVNIDKPTRVILSQPPEEGTLVLDEGSYWRCHFTWTQRWQRDWNWSHTTFFPPGGWMKPDFDDGAWARWRIGRTNYRDFPYGIGTFGQALKLLCLRGKFTVKKPGEADLAVWLAYRGGMVVYVNGKEIARQHLPEGAAPDTFAEPYPREAFYLRKGRPFRVGGGELQKNKELADLRVRRLSEIKIPNSLLRKGTNVLALEIHATPFDEPTFRKDNLNFRSHWNPCGLISLKLHTPTDWQVDAVKANITRPRGLQVFNADVTDVVTVTSWGDQHEPLRPIRIVGARNGAFCGKVVVACTPGQDINVPAALRKVRARMSDLKQAGGAAIPTSAIEVRYARYETNRRSLQFDGLLDQPPAEIPRQKPERWDRGLQPGAVQPIWIKVRVPANAKPGDYEGTLTVEAQGLKATTVPVKLRVIDWQLPDPRDFKTHMGVIQSPESVALQYGVPFWSEKHWQLMEKSFALLGEIGGRYVCIPLITRTNFGNSESMVRWIKKPDGGYTHDFTIFDRYVDLAQKYLKPDVVCIYVWDRYMASLSWGTRPVPGVGAKVTLLDPATGKVTEMQGPTYEDPAAIAFWKPVLDGVVARLKKRGLYEHLKIGIYCERAPSKGTVTALKELLPGVPWIENSHGYYGSLQGVPVGYHTQVYVNMFPPPRGWDEKRKVGWMLPVACDIFPRSGGPATRNPLHQVAVFGVYRITMEAAILANKSGLGRTGVDFWPVLGRDEVARVIKAGGEKRSRTITARFPETSWNQLNMGTATEWLLAPGPEGAVPSTRFEMIREGVQECEARIFIEQALEAGTLDEALAAKCRTMLDKRALIIRAACTAKGGRGGRGGGFLWYGATCLQPLAEELFTRAAEVQKALAVE